MSYYGVPEFIVGAGNTTVVEVEPAADQHTVQVSGTAVNLRINARLAGSTVFSPVGAAVTVAGVYYVDAVGVAELQFVNGSANSVTLTVAGRS